MKHLSQEKTPLITCLTFVAFGGVLLAVGESARGEVVDELAKEFRGRAPGFVEFLRAQGCNNIGVLKFRVQKGREPASDNVGTLNHDLSERLRAALILAIREEGARHLGVIGNANVVAQRCGGAHHREPGRRTLLAADGYELAWLKTTTNETPVRADAFLTGLGIIPPSGDRLRVVVQVFDRFDKTCMLRTLADFTVLMTPSLQDSVNESFTLRGGFDGGEVQLADVSEQVMAVKNNVAANFPLVQPDAPLQLEVLYDGQRQAIELRNGKAFLPEPKQGQQVELVLAHTGRVDATLGVVLKLNGENTLFRERKKAFDCSMWVLEPRARTLPIRGYQKTSGEAEQFTVLSAVESARNEINYGSDVGTISVVVFRPETKRHVPDISDEAEDLAAIGNPVFPGTTPQSLPALQAQLRQNAVPLQTRGLIAEGEDLVQSVRKVNFQPDPIPILSATIHYYRPQN